MTELCDHCGHALPNAVGVGLYCTNCGEPVSTTAKTIEHIRKESNVTTTEELRYAVLAVGIYRTIDDKFAPGGQTIESLIFTFNEYEARAVREVVRVLVGYGALIEDDDFLIAAPDASG